MDKDEIKEEIYSSIKPLFPDNNIPTIELEIPQKKEHGNLSCNIALKSSKILKKSPLDLANQFVEKLSENQNVKALTTSNIDRIEVVKPGFINFYFSNEAVSPVLVDILNQNDDYGRVNLGKGQKWQLEFVSANPTGPLSIAHARQAAVGDALGNILSFLGFDVTKEFYVNDEGNQINLLGESLKIRILEIFGDSDAPKQLGDDHYKGEYVKDIAQLYIKENGIKGKEDIDGQEVQLSKFAAEHILGIIQQELKDFNVNFDVWAKQSEICDEKSILDVLDKLHKKDLTFEKDGAVWFRTTDFSDDKDRVLKKSDGSYTYLTPDIAYHNDKFERGFQKVVNIWGPDHHGYIARIKATVQALGYNAEDLDVLIVQLATIYRDGSAVPMSTRAGKYISLREVMQEVGVDVARFFFLMRHIKVHLDFDLDLAKNESPENPVYYIQYAHARIHSINKKAQEEGLKLKTDEFKLLTTDEEFDLMVKLMEFKTRLLHVHQQLDPYPLVNYLQELAALFHRFYDKQKVLEDNKELSSERLGLINAVRIVLANGLTLLGMSTPESM